MTIGTVLPVSGCFTKEKFIAGRSLADIERILERLVKVLPMTRHDPLMHPDIQYPPGQGAPQWIATVPVMGKVVALVSGYPDGRYIVGATGGA